MRYLELCEVYENLEKNPSRLKKTKIISEFLNKLKLNFNQETKPIIYLLRGNVFPEYEEKEFGISIQVTIKAISKATGESEKNVIERYRKIGDLGDVVFEIIKNKLQSTLFVNQINISNVIKNLKMLPEIDGKGAIDKKIALISEILTSAEPIEGKYLIRTLIKDLRIGVGEGTIRDAIVKSFFKEEEYKEATVKIQTAFDQSIDFALVFEKAIKNQLSDISLSPGKPTKVMLFLKTNNIKEAFEKVGKPAALEYKYDGFRMMINKFNNEKNKEEIKIFTRKLDNVTKQFPDVVNSIKNIDAESFIIDCEAVGYDPTTKKYMPFQEISQRIKRKYNIEIIEKKLPVELNVFDILYYNGKSLINEPFEKRREILEKIITPIFRKIVLAKQIKTSNELQAQEFFEKAIKDNVEGLMIKSLSAPYKPGARVGYGVKLKEEAKELDLVITGAEYGTGKRAGWLTSYTLSCKKENKFVEIGKASTGLKEKKELGLSFIELTKLIKDKIIKSKGREVIVEPSIVVEVGYQNIQKSPTYNSGYALRFPRIKRLRPDKNIHQISTIEDIRKETRNWNSFKSKKILLDKNTSI